MNNKSARSKKKNPESWHVLVCGLPLESVSFNIGSSIILRQLVEPLSVFDLASAGAVGFREWSALEQLAPAATAEIISPTEKASSPGYDALNECWLVSALLVLRGFTRHLCPAVSGYSWNFIAGHQKQTSGTFKKQLIEEGIHKAVYEPRNSLPPFQGGLLDYHLTLLVPPETINRPFNSDDANWFRENFDKFNLLAAEDERFRFGLEASIDWRYAKDTRIAISRIWAGIESIFAIKSELVYRISIMAASVMAKRGPERLEAFKHIKNIYKIRSKAVHGEPLSEQKLFSGLHDSFEILRHLLLDAVARGRLKTEEDYLYDLLS